MFKQFDMETDVDRVLVYVTLYIIECLKRLQKVPNLERATQEMFSMALESFALPGEAGFPLNAFFAKPNKNEADELKKYLTQVSREHAVTSYIILNLLLQLRHETGARLAEKVYDPALTSNGPSKWWTCWSKRKFLNVSLQTRR